MKTLACVLCFFVTAFLLGCGLEDSSDTSVDATPKPTASMCYNKSGNTLYVNCRSAGTCGDYGQTSLASYTDMSTCKGDMQTVVDNYSRGGGIVAGPNAMGGNGGSGGSGSGGGTQLNCGSAGSASEVWSGTYDPQVTPFCQEACSLYNSGATSEASQTCAIMTSMSPNAANQCKVPVPGC